MSNPRSGLAAPDLPHSVWQAMGRGLRFACPRCGGGRLFRKWLKPAGHCACCGLDLSPQQADDFPAYVAILVTGHLLAPVMVALGASDLSLGAMLAILIPSSVAMMLAMLQPAKGAIIAAQWWGGLHGFRKERRAP